MRNRSTGTLVLIGISCFAQEVMAQCPGIKPEFAWHSDGSTILFQDLTNYLGYTPTSRSWSFGDGYFGMGTDTVHTYDTTGVALAEFQVFIGACEYHATALVAHGGASDNCGVPLFADFASTPTGNNNEMSFTDQSFSSGQGFADLWEFGDGALDLSLSPVHPYLYPGAYTVNHSIAVADTLQQTGCVAGRSRRVFVDGNSSTCDSSLFLDFSYTGSDGSYVFDAQTVIMDPDLSITQLWWDMGDQSASLSTMTTPVYLYPFFGTYQVCLYVQAFNNGTMDSCSARVCHTIETFANVGVAELGGALKLSAYPVPFDDVLMVDGDEMMPGDQWQLVGALGRIALSGSVNCAHSLNMATRSLVPGPYVLRILSGRVATCIRVSKQ